MISDEEIAREKAVLSEMREDVLKEFREIAKESPIMNSPRYTITWNASGYAHEASAEAFISMTMIAEALSIDQDVLVINNNTYGERRFVDGMIQWTDATF